MPKDRRIFVPRNWERTRFRPEDISSMVRELSKVFTHAAIERLKGRGQLLRALVYKGLLYSQNHSSSRFDSYVKLGIQLADKQEEKLLKVFIPEAVKYFREEGYFQQALIYMNRLFPIVNGKLQVNTTINTLEGIPGIKLKPPTPKGRVNIDNLDANISMILPTIVRAYKEFRIKENVAIKDMVITSGNDGTHTTIKSLHFKNKAIDLRSNYLTDSKQLKLADLLQKRLGGNFSVLSEHFYFCFNNHIHIGYKKTLDSKKATLYVEYQKKENRDIETVGNRKWDEGRTKKDGKEEICPFAKKAK